MILFEVETRTMSLYKRTELCDNEVFTSYFHLNLTGSAENNLSYALPKFFANKNNA